MGSVYFFSFLTIIFFIAIFFIILSTVLIIIWKSKKRKGKSPKKWWLVLPIVLLIINGLVALIPLGYLGFLRLANSTVGNDNEYVKTDTVLYWPKDIYESTGDWFEMDDTNYIRISGGALDHRFYFNYDNQALGEPVANIKTDDPFIVDVITFIFGGNTDSEKYKATIYSVQNDWGYGIYYVHDKHSTFCAEENLESALDYYEDYANYDTQNIACEYAIYTDDEEVTQTRRDTPFIHLEKVVVLKPHVFETIQQFYVDAGDNLEYVEISQKYRDLDEAAMPGTPIFGYASSRIKIDSKDNVTYREITFDLIENQVYIPRILGYGYITAFPLPDDLNQYIIDTVFAE